MRSYESRNYLKYDQGFKGLKKARIFSIDTYNLVIIILDV